MELQQLGNLVEINQGVLVPGEVWRGDAQVMVVDADGRLWPTMSLGWSTEDHCFVICPDYDA